MCPTDTAERAAVLRGEAVGLGSPQHNHLSALRPGARLNSYTIGAILGVGGFGITYKAREDITGREVAIKEYLPTAFAVRDRDGATVRSLSKGAARDFAWGLKRFRREATLLIEFRHPNIVPVLSYLEANGTAYIVMEFQTGTSLAEILGRTPTMSEEQVLELMVPILDGIEEVHRHNLLHRDIKPENIFIRRDGTPVLLDFGAAREGRAAGSKTITTLLTEGYAPFEQYAGTGNQGPWSDIYALAALMFRCLTGKTPVEAPRRAIAKLRGLPDPLAQGFVELRRRVSADLAFAIEAGMRVVEHERPQSVAALRELMTLARPTTTQIPPDEAPSPSSTTLIPDIELRPGASRILQQRHAAERRRPGPTARYIIMAASILGVTSGAYVAGQERWLPESLHRVEVATTSPRATPPSTDAAAKARLHVEDDWRQLDEPRRLDDNLQRRSAEAQRIVEERELEERKNKALLEYQRQHLEQIEAERRVYLAERRAAEVERTRSYGANPLPAPIQNVRPPDNPGAGNPFQTLKLW